MEHKTRCRRRQGGGYDLSYGRGENKLIGDLVLFDNEWTAMCGGPPPDGVWFPATLKRDAIAKWHAWAVGVYHGVDEQPAVEPDPADTTESEDGTPLLDACPQDAPQDQPGPAGPDAWDQLSRSARNTLSAYLHGAAAGDPVLKSVIRSMGDRQLMGITALAIRGLKGTEDGH